MASKAAQRKLHLILWLIYTNLMSSWVVNRKLRIHLFLHARSFLILMRSTVRTDRYQEVACLLQSRRALSQRRKLLEFQYNLPDWKKLFVASYYRPPSDHPLSLHLLDDSLSRLFSAASFPRLILGGDDWLVMWSSVWQFSQYLRASPLRSLWQIWPVPACSLTYRGSAILRSPVKPGLCLTSYSHPSCHVVPGISNLRSGPVVPSLLRLLMSALAPISFRPSREKGLPTKRQ